MDETIAKVIRDADGNYFVIDQDGTQGPACKRIEENGRTIALTKNASGRQYVSKAKVDAAIDGGAEFYSLTLKTTESHAGKLTYHMPNEKLISYLPEDLQEEYKAIIARAIEARNADKKVPVAMTEREKLEAKIAKAQAALEKLMQEDNQ